MQHLYFKMITSDGLYAIYMQGRSSVFDMKDDLVAHWGQMPHISVCLCETGTEHFGENLWGLQA